MKYLTNEILYLQYLHTKHLIDDITYQGMLKKAKEQSNLNLNFCNKRN